MKWKEETLKSLVWLLAPRESGSKSDEKGCVKVHKREAMKGNSIANKIAGPKLEPRLSGVWTLKSLPDVADKIRVKVADTIRPVTPSSRVSATL